MPIVYVVFFGLAGASLKLVSTQLLLIFAAPDTESFSLGYFAASHLQEVYTFVCCLLLHGATCVHSSISSNRSIMLCSIAQRRLASVLTACVV